MQQKVKKCIEKPQSEAANRNFDDSIEAVLLRAANEKSRAIDDEVFLVSRYIRDNYSPRFPGLEKLIPNYVDYAKAVHFLGNDPVAKLRQSRQGTGRSGDSLDGVLDRPTLMTVEMSLVQHDGRELRPNEFNRVQKACSLLIDLDEARRILANFVQSRMALFAPNMTALLDHNTAAKIITTAGGLTKLTKFPASNLPSMGAKNSIIGMSTNVSVRKEGFVYFSPFIQDLNLDTDIKKKAIRILSAKIVLAARCDAARVSLDGAEGKKFRLQAETTIQKLLKPPKHKGHRALPKPDDKTSKKRGGRQARRVKAATDQTQMSKLADRLNFNQAEEEVLIDGEFQGLGMLGQGQDGQIRSVKIDARTRAKVSKKNNNWLNGAATQAGSATSLQNELRGGTQAGSATSLRAFGLRTSGVGNDGSATAAGGSTTSITFGKGRQQGVVLADPGLADDERKRKMTDEKWFSASTYAPVDADGFKKPLLPALKRVKKQK